MRAFYVAAASMMLWLAGSCGPSSQARQPGDRQEPGATLSGASAAPDTPRKMERIRVAYSSPTAAQLVTYIAREAGLFAKHGLEVELELVGGALTVPTIVSGEYQFAQTGAEQIASAYLEGSDLVMVATMVPVLQMNLVGIPEVRSASDLKGKRVGITGFGSLSHKAARLALERLGLNPDRDVTFIQVRDNPTLRGAMIGGAVEAGSMGRTNALPLAREGMNILVDLLKEGIDYPSANIFTTRAYAQAHRGVVSSFLKAILESLKLYLSDMDQAAVMFQRFARLEDREAAEEVIQAGLLYLRPLPVTSRDGLQVVLNFMAEDDPRVRSVQAQALIDMSYLQELESQGFLKQLWGALPDLTKPGRFQELQSQGLPK